MTNHLKLAHLLWKDHLKPGMTVIDATAGNGHDTLFLAQNTLTETSGHLIAYDIQEKALQNTRQRLSENLPASLLDRITLRHESHAILDVKPSSVDLIVYNLGYLPGGNKEITTIAPSTLQSVQSALVALSPTGLLTITAYPAHPQGFIETEALFKWFLTVDPERYRIMHHAPLNRHKSPSVISLKQANFK